MRIMTAVSYLCLITLCGGCGSIPVGPKVTVMPSGGKSLELFNVEDSTCRRWAEKAGSGTGSVGAPQQRYDNTYLQCMYSYGNQIPEAFRLAAKGSSPSTAGASPQAPSPATPPLPAVDRGKGRPAAATIPLPPGLPDSGRYGEPAGIYLDAAPLFIYSPALGLYVAVGIPYDLVFDGIDYFYCYAGTWYRGPFYDGPWMLAPGKYFPRSLSRFGIADIRNIRDQEFGVYTSDQAHYGGRTLRPEFRGTKRKPEDE